jgi:DMSO/TMAO reductase YedYZ molybdopterin-dependent catalytic subunit
MTPEPKVELRIVDQKQLKKRLVRSLVGGICFFSVVIFTFLKIQNAPEDDAIAKPLRQAFHWNESVWSTLHSNSRLSPDLPRPPTGTKPRFNGDLGLNSKVDLQNYQVEIDSGGKTISLPMSAFQAMPKAGYSTLFKCIEGWSETVQYGGARFSDFMEAYHLGIKPDGSKFKYVGLETPDKEYYVSVDMDSMLHPQTVLAYEMDDQPLSIQNGAPLRLIIPVKYGIKSIKRIGHIFFSDTRPPDYWAEQGYDWWAGL